MKITAPSGVLEAEYESAPHTRNIQAVLCHPHPQYGGTMHDAVLACLSRALLARGVGCLRFNFRGVGASDGHFDGGQGEVDDLLAALDWLEAEFPDDVLWLGGYSFGSHVIWQALPQLPEVRRVLLVAPPVGTMDFSAPAPDCPVDVFVGTEDPFVDPDALAAWAGVIVHPITAANHFFHGQEEALATRIAQALG